MAAGGFSLRHLFIVDDASDAPKATSASEDDINALLNGVQQPPAIQDLNAAPPPDSPPPVAGAPGTEQDLVLPEGVELATIYADAGVPATAFSIEKLAKLVDGLNQLDVATKKTAVAAMDAADDSWDIATVIADGKAKRAALSGYQNTIAAAESAINAQITNRLNANQADKANRLTDIDQQIAALQSTREQIITETAHVAATLRAQGSAAADAAERERNRVTNAIRGFDNLIALFDAISIPSARPPRE